MDVVRPPLWRSALIAFALVYGPYTLSFFIGPLMECDHCIEIYIKFFVALPTWIVIAKPLEFSTAGLVTGTLASLVGVAALALMHRRFKARIVWSIGLLIAGFGCLSSLGFSALIRA